MGLDMDNRKRLFISPLWDSKNGVINNSSLLLAGGDKSEGRESYWGPGTRAKPKAEVDQNTEKPFVLTQPQP